MTEFDTFATEIARRQYMLEGEKYVEHVLERAVDVVRPFASSDQFVDQMYDLMQQKKFIPGGRILAGAGTPHGNLLNCFVQDGSPHEPGTTEATMALALKLAQVTRVGGGNGLNLDAYPAKRDRTTPIGRAFITINPFHPDYDNVKRGRFLNVVTGEYQEVRRRATIFASPGEVIEIPRVPMQTIVVQDSTKSIWESASEMVQSMLAGNDIVIDLSRLRSEGAKVRGSGGTSSGPASFAMEVFDNFAYWAILGGADCAGPVATLRYVFAPTLRVIRQGGVRRGAGMATLSMDHPDIEDFITCKDLDREQNEGDIGTFNISVLADHSFMRMSHAFLDSPGKERFKLLDIAEHAWATGEPGLLFKETINENNPLAEVDGPILSTNP